MLSDKGPLMLNSIVYLVKAGKRLALQALLFAILISPMYASDQVQAPIEAYKGSENAIPVPGPMPRLRIPPSLNSTGENTGMPESAGPATRQSPMIEGGANTPAGLGDPGKTALTPQPLPAIVPAQPLVQPSQNTFNPGTSEPQMALPVVKKIEPGTAVLNFSNANLADIIRTVAELTGENFILAPGLSARITVLTTKPVPKKDIFSIFESVLEINGLSAVKAGPYYKIVQAPQARQKALDLLNSSQPSDVPQGDSMMNVIVPVEFISANELMQIIRPMLSQAGNATLYSKANTLILTDHASIIKKLLEFIEYIDIDAFKRMHIDIVSVQNVDIKSMNKELTEVFSALGFGRDTSQLSIIPIERLNSFIILSSSTQLLASVKEWIDRLDKRTSGEASSIHIYYVQNEKASNLKTILEQLYGGKRAIPLSTAVASQSQPTSQPMSNIGSSASEEIRFFIYEPSNALIIQSSRMDYQSILSTIQELDRVPKQVLIEALILEVKLDESTRFGIQWSALTGNFNLQQNTGLFTTTLNDPAGNISTPVGLPAPSGLTAFATDSTKFFTAIQALASTGKINVLSNPHLVVKNYEKASMNVGSDEPVATQSSQTAVTGSTGLIQNIEYRKTGIILTVIPQISEGGMVAMSIRQEVSDKSTDRIVGDRTYPSFTKREVETSVVTKDRQTLVIGGLIQERKDRTDSGIPLLSKIPILGNLFKLTSFANGKTELLILITPRVISNEEQADLAFDELKSKLEQIKKQLE